MGISVQQQNNNANLGKTKIDLHVHTSYSRDSTISIEDLVNVYMEKGLMVAVTDHDTVDSWERIAMKGVPFIPGEEISTGDGHVIGLFLTEHIPKGLGFYETVDRIREQHALVYCPHPFDIFRHSVNDERRILSCDIIEVFNSRSVLNRFNNKASALAEKYKKPKAVGSDAHFSFEIGNSYIELCRDHINDPKEFLNALDGGTLHSTKTAVLVHGTTRFVKVMKRLGFLR